MFDDAINAIVVNHGESHVYSQIYPKILNIPELTQSFTQKTSWSSSPLQTLLCRATALPCQQEKGGKGQTPSWGDQEWLFLGGALGPLMALTVQVLYGISGGRSDLPEIFSRCNFRGERSAKRHIHTSPFHSRRSLRSACTNICDRWPCRDA